MESKVNNVMSKNDIHIIVGEKNIELFNSATCVAGTTGYQGGDSGHGGRTIFGIVNNESTCMSIGYKSADGDFEYIEHVDEAFICLGGDCEIDTMIESLEFALGFIKKNSENDFNGKIRRFFRFGWRYWLLDVKRKLF